jgi:hypothetical protein
VNVDLNLTAIFTSVPFWGAVVILGGLYMFRDPIKAFFTRAKRFSAFGTAVDAADQPEPVGRAVAAMQPLADERRLLERMMAFEETVEREKTAVLRLKAAEFDEKKKQLAQALFDIYGATSKELSQEQRARVLDIIARADQDIGEALKRAEQAAPAAAASSAQWFLLYITQALTILGESFVELSRSYKDLRARGVMSEEGYQQWGRIARSFQVCYVTVHRAWSPVLGANPDSISAAIVLLLRGLREEMARKQAELIAAHEAKTARHS